MTRRRSFRRRKALAPPPRDEGGHDLCTCELMLMMETLPAASLLRQEPRSQGPRVMLVEDERISRRALAALLAASGYQTEAFASAEEALDVLEHEDALPRIFLIDLNLPGMNGLDLIDRISKLGTDDPYVVLITAQEGDTLLDQLRNRGVAYMQKPVNVDRLLAMIAKRQRPH
jgi:CheY-like chemotaxis protein